MTPKRSETRSERYAVKSKTAQKLPFAFCAANFSYDANIAYLARALACFGGEDLHVIGKPIAENELNRLSGGHSKLIKFHYYSNPQEFLEYSRAQNLKLVVAELDDNSVNLHSFKFDYAATTVIIVGNEMDGIPIELAKNAELVYIPMPGKGFCLNTSQTANIFAYEYAKNYKP